MKMKKTITQCLKLWCMLILFSPALAAQGIKITGTITEGEKSDPIPGVNVLIKGTSQGTVTDMDGKYSIDVPGSETTLVFSSVGYLTEEVLVGSRSVINLVMRPDITALEEIVVVGYGTQSKRDVTGAISTVKGADIADMPVPSFEIGLQGKATGVQIVQGGGVAGAPSRIQIRGTGSLTAGTQPLYVIDGMIINQPIRGFENNRTGTALNPLGDINPNDIESIEVLKDAAATAIYGSRGANGVILVTTKTGKVGRGAVTFDYNRTVSDVINKVTPMGGSDFLETVDLSRENQNRVRPASGLTPGWAPLAFRPALNDPYSRAVAEATDVDYASAMLRQGITDEFNISASDASERSSYYVSGAYRDENSIFEGNRLQRYIGRANLEFRPHKKVAVGTKTNVSYTRNQKAVINEGFQRAYSNALPIFPLRNQNGTYFDAFSTRNAVANIDIANRNPRTEQYRTIASAYINYEPIAGLTLRAEALADLLQLNDIDWTGGTIREAGNVGYEYYRTVRNSMYNFVANYNKDLGSDHYIGLTAGMERQITLTRRGDFEMDRIVGANQEIGETGNPIRTVFGIDNDIYFTSVFARANYKFKNRYLFGASMRRDGSSNFAPNNRFGYFPSASAGWIISDEAFASGSTALSFLKVRASYGVTGNADIVPFAWQTNYIVWPLYGSGPAAWLTNRFGTSDLSWETTNTIDAGIDFGFFNDRITGNFGYYNRTTNDMLLNVPVAPSIGQFGAGDVVVNVGDMRNTGIELSLTTVNIEKQHFRWTTNFNFTTNKAVVLTLTEQLAANPLGFSSGNIGGVNPLVTGREGSRLGTYYLPEFAGINPDNGLPMIVNQSNGEAVVATQANWNNNRVHLEDKTGLPTYFGGFSNNLTYKNFDVTLLFTFQGGNWLYDTRERDMTIVNGGNNTLDSRILGNTWTPDNRDAEYPVLLFNNRDADNNAINHNTTKYLHKGDFVRLRTLQIAYNLPTDLLSKAGIKSARVYANAHNLLTFTKFPGWDPEVVNILNNQQTLNLAPGLITTGTLPQVRSFNFGVSFTF
ncbi:MAG: TonB-dependent receptor [Cyclobacteriaceae bacterium]|nr:TonB-dependent receptor [Cyclobacteriaceae bacterium]